MLRIQTILALGVFSAPTGELEAQGEILESGLDG